MKVYDYLTITTNNKIDECMEFTTYMFDTYGISDLRDFYNLPFTPELITKYFKGWHVDDCSDYDFAEFAKENDIVEFGEYHDEILYQIETFKVCHIWEKPLVLNDFIRDCERVGIELEM